MQYPLLQVRNIATIHKADALKFRMQA